MALSCMAEQAVIHVTHRLLRICYNCCLHL